MAFKSIPLTRGLSALVDEEDYSRLSVYKWKANWNKSGRNFYAARLGSRVNGKRRAYLMHREILAAGSGQLVDHINHDTLDNRRSNLRTATRAQNQWNRRANQGSASGMKGVSKLNNRWAAQITINGSRLHLGSFATAEAAHSAYVTAAKKHFGEFASVL